MAKKTHKSARAAQDVKRLAAMARAYAMVAQYASLKSTPPRQETPIPVGATETEMVFSGVKRIRAYAQADELYENDFIGSTLNTCIRLAVGTRGGNPSFVGEDAATLQTEFSAWKRHCGFAEGENWQEVLKLILLAVKLHGDCVILCDPVLTGSKIRIWDADQVASMEAGDFRAWCEDTGHTGSRQVEGAVTTDEGQVIGWFVTGLRNRVSVGRADCMFVPAGLGRRVSYRRRVTQYRGEPQVLANMNLTRDTHDLLSAEVGAARLAAEMSLVVRQPDDVGGMLKGMLEGYTEQDTQAVLTGTGITDEDVAALTSAVDAGKAFKAWAGRASVVSVPQGTEVSNLSGIRPSESVQDWTNLLADANGRQLGVMSCLSRGRADNSYSSGQIELAISWSAFEEDQKLLERQVVDYCIGCLWPGAEYAVAWPRAFEIDPEKSEKVLDLRLRGGRTTYREILGPDWKARLKQLAEEQEYIKSLGMNNLSVFTTASGAVIEEANTDENI